MLSGESSSFMLSCESSSFMFSINVSVSTCRSHLKAAQICILKSWPGVLAS